MKLVQWIRNQIKKEERKERYPSIKIKEFKLTQKEMLPMKFSAIVP